MEHELSERRQAPASRARTGLTLAVDAGRTATRAAVTDGALRRPVGHGPGVRHLQAPGGVEHALAAIAADGAYAPRGVAVVAVGLSGVTTAEPALERLAAELARRLGAALVWWRATP